MSRNKYSNKKVTVDGHKFDSKREARYYQHLKLLERAGEIQGFILQPRYILQESFKKYGKTHRKIEYVADFEVYLNDGSTEVIDVKGMITKDFAIKRKLFDKKYSMPLKLMTYDQRFGGWIELEELNKLKKPNNNYKKLAR
ncbi:DUF1064 domain-containing protein [Ornithinibacillus xuwenensis]|uniref:DUF1064 domain-containing protein n=1 Tax=Ornithinibacillus xuwenensis TaxID=3144668 RepID=A0ABU9XF85_9BACI